MKSKKIIVNEVEVECFEDGSISKKHGRTGETVRTYGFNQSSGYMATTTMGKLQLVHRLMAMAFIDGFSQSDQVDHIDGNKKNNEISNLRRASNSDNAKGYQPSRPNSSSIYRGVWWDKSMKKWQAGVYINKKCTIIGYFDREADAAIARDSAAVTCGYPLESLNSTIHDLT